MRLWSINLEGLNY